MRWIVAIEGNRRDIERLVAAYSRVAAGDDGGGAVITFEDGHDEATDATRETIRREIETALRHINASGKLRWGRSFEGVSIRGVKYESASGAPGQVVFGGTAYGHLTPQDSATQSSDLASPGPTRPSATRRSRRSTSLR